MHVCVCINNPVRPPKCFTPLNQWNCILIRPSVGSAESRGVCRDGGTGGGGEDNDDEQKGRQGQHRSGKEERKTEGGGGSGQTNASSFFSRQPTIIITTTITNSTNTKAAPAFSFPSLFGGPASTPKGKATPVTLSDVAAAGQGGQWEIVYSSILKSA